jgi:hypothetical protein
LLQQPVGQLVASQTHKPPTQVWPLVHAGLHIDGGFLPQPSASNSTLASIIVRDKRRVASVPTLRLLPRVGARIGDVCQLGLVSRDNILSPRVLPRAEHLDAELDLYLR